MSNFKYTKIVNILNLWKIKLLAYSLHRHSLILTMASKGAFENNYDDFSLEAAANILNDSKDGVCFCLDYFVASCSTSAVTATYPNRYP